MIKKQILSSLLLFFVLSAPAQKEVYFADKVKDSISISGMQGIIVNPYVKLSSIGINVPVIIGYFRELKLGSTTSLTFYGNIIGAKTVKSLNNILDENGYITDQNIIYELGISLDIEAEPRWYINYKDRYLYGKNIKLNSGWFVGLPTGIYTNPMTSVYPFVLNIKTAGSFGYRYAFSNNFFVEPSANLGIGLYSFKYLSTLTPYLSLKAAYTFK